MTINSVPGKVSGLSWNSTGDTLAVHWQPPQLNPQCLDIYRVVIVGGRDTKPIIVDVVQTQMVLDGLTPCSDFSVAVVSRPGDAEVRTTASTSPVGTVTVIFSPLTGIFSINKWVWSYLLS